MSTDQCTENTQFRYTLGQINLLKPNFFSSLGIHSQTKSFAMESVSNCIQVPEEPKNRSKIVSSTVKNLSAFPQNDQTFVLGLANLYIGRNLESVLANDFITPLGRSTCVPEGAT